MEANIMLELPDYEDFVNFFKDIVPAMEKTDDPYLIDVLVRFVFLNFFVDDKKVVRYKLNEPFNSYWGTKNQSGVGEETLFEQILQNLDDLKVRWSWLFNPTLTFDDFKLGL